MDLETGQEDGGECEVWWISGKLEWKIKQGAALSHVQLQKHNPQNSKYEFPSMQRRTSFFSHHPRVSGSCCANSWDRFTAQKMRYPLAPSVRNTKKLARNLRNLMRWTFSSTWAALSSMMASCSQAKQNAREAQLWKRLWIEKNKKQHLN